MVAIGGFCGAWVAGQMTAESGGGLSLLFCRGDEELKFWVLPFLQLLLDKQGVVFLSRRPRLAAVDEAARGYSCE